jgi:hypothetical protein
MTETVSQIRFRYRLQELLTIAKIIDYIDNNGKGYSREFIERGGVKLALWRVQKILKRLENEGEVISEIEQPPFNDSPKGRMQRRYYRRGPNSKINTNSLYYLIFHRSFLINPGTK